MNFKPPCRFLKVVLTISAAILVYICQLPPLSFAHWDIVLVSYQNKIMKNKSVFLRLYRSLQKDTQTSTEVAWRHPEVTKRLSEYGFMVVCRRMPSGSRFFCGTEVRDVQQVAQRLRGKLEVTRKSQICRNMLLRDLN